MYYLFSSNARDRYIQDILNVLALPDSVVYQFRYSEKYVQDPLLRKANRKGSIEEAQGKDGLVVFVDQPEDPTKHDEDIHFYPLRKVRIRSMKVEGKIVCVRFELGDYVDWQDLCSLSDDDRDDLIKKSVNALLRPPIKYVARADPPSTDMVHFAGADRATTAWQHVVECLNPVTCFKQTVFFRISGLVQYRGTTLRSKFGNIFRREKLRHYRPKERGLRSDILPELSGYELRGDSTNMLRLDFYHVDNEHTRFRDVVDKKIGILPKYDTAYYSYSPKAIPVTFRYDNYLVPLVVSSLNRDVLTEIGITLDPSSIPDDVSDGSPSGALTQPGNGRPSSRQDVLRAPQVFLVLKLTYPRAAFYLNFALLFVSQAVTAFAGRIGDVLTALGFSSAVVDVGTAIDPVLSVLAPLGTTVLLFLLFRRLPAGSK